MRQDSDHASLRIGGALLWIHPDVDHEIDLHTLADPDGLFASPQCVIIKDQRKIRVGRLALKVAGKTKRLYLKRYNAFSWRYRLGSLLSTSGAHRSWIGAEILLRAGFQTAKPTAAVEWRSWGMLTKSFYLSEEIPGARTIDDYWRCDLRPAAGIEGVRRRRRFLYELAELFRLLHERNIYHNDLKDANILFSPRGGSQECPFYLLDLEGIRRYRHLSKRHRLKNLVQLNRTMGRYLRRAERIYLLKVYLGDAFADRIVKRRWIKWVLKGSARGDRRSLRKRCAYSAESNIGVSRS